MPDADALVNMNIADTPLTATLKAAELPPLRRAAWWAWLGFALFGFIGTGAGNTLLVLTAVLLLASVLAEQRDTRIDPLLAVAGVFLVYLLARTWLAAAGMPALAGEQWQAASAWGAMWFFVVGAVLMAGRLDRLTLTLLLFCAGFFAEALMDFEWHLAYEMVVTGEHRATFGMTTNAAGLYGACGLLFAVYLLLPGGEPLPRPWRIGLALAAVAFAFMLYASQSRAAWGLTLLALGGFVVYMLTARYTGGRVSRGRAGAELAGVALATVMGVAAILQVEQVQERIRYTVEKDLGVITALVRGDVEAVPKNSSLGDRVYMYRLGADYVAQRPWLGWGPGTSIPRTFAKDSPWPHLERFSDLHNGFFIVLARLGLVGLAILVAAGAYLVVKLAGVALKPDTRRGRLAGAALICMAVTTAISIMNFRWIHADFTFFWGVLGAAAYTLTMRPASAAHEKRSGS